MLSSSAMSVALAFAITAFGTVNADTNLAKYCDTVCTINMVLEDNFEEEDLEETDNPDEHSPLRCREYAVCINEDGADIVFDMPLKDLWLVHGLGGGDEICVSLAESLAGTSNEDFDKYRNRRDTYTFKKMPPFVVISKQGANNQSTRNTRQFAEAVAPLGPRTVIIFRVTYKTNGNVYTPTYCGLGCVRDNMFTGTKNVAGLINQISDGKTTFSQQNSRIMDITVPRGIYENGCKFWEIGLEVDAIASAQGVDLSKYDHKSYYLPQNLGGCTFGGLGYVGCSPTYCKSWIRQGAGGTLGHELSHNLGLWHSALDYSNDGNQESEYGDNSDLMGSTTNWRGVNGPHRFVLNWVDFNNQVRNYEHWDMYCTNPKSLRLFSLSTPGQTDKIEMLMLTRSAPGGGKYYISLRTNTGYDSGLSSVWQNQVYVHYLTMHSTRFQTNTMLVGRYKKGMKFKEPLSKITITVTALNALAGYADLEYHFCADGESPVTTAAPTIQPTMAPAASRSFDNPTCTDDDPRKCPEWASEPSNYCRKDNMYEAYMHEHCKLSCGLCSPQLGAKAGGKVFEAAERLQCAMFEEGQPKPKCGASAGGVECCVHDNAQCIPVRRNSFGELIYKCVVKGRKGQEKLDDGSTCTKNSQCKNKCDKTTWKCTANPRLRTRRAAEEDGDFDEDEEFALLVEPPSPFPESSAKNQAALIVIVASVLVVGVALSLRRSSIAKQSGKHALVEPFVRHTLDLRLSPVPDAEESEGEEPRTQVVRTSMPHSPHQLGPLESGLARSDVA